MSELKINIQADYTRASLERARADIDRLLDSLPETPSAPPHLPEAEQLAAAKVDALWRRLGLNTRAFLSGAARFPDETWFTFQDVADLMHEDVKTVKSWHRNMSRSLKRVEADLGSEPRILEQRWNGERNEYSFPPAVQLAIRAQHPAKLPGSDTE